MRNINFALTWYLTAVSSLFFGLLLLLNFTLPRNISSLKAAKYQIYQALPTSSLNSNSQEVSLEKTDARVIIIHDFFSSYKAPLIDQAAKFVEVADKYNLDYRLLPAISMQESNGGKRLPKDSNNPFGYGIYGNLSLKFNSFEEAIDRVAKGLRTDYISQGLKTPEEIMSKYTPPSKASGGSWAIGVASFMDELR